eukprot:scaffold13457_cov306-Amphora_coffeaeformis.AAC.1
MAPPDSTSTTYASIQQQHEDEEALVEGKDATSTLKNGNGTSSSSEMDHLLVSNNENNNKTLPTKTNEKATYELSFPFQVMSGFVWLSMFLWGVWIATFYSMAVMFDYNKLNIVFPDLWTPSHPLASWSMIIHFIGAFYMSCAGAVQLVKYIRKTYPAVHRWIGRLYIIASLIASTGGLIFCLTKGSYGGKQADYAFVTYGFIFLISGCMCYYRALRKEFQYHKLWAWRLYSLSLAAWLYRFDYYLWMLFFGKGENSWLHHENYTGLYDYFINWGFYVPGLIVVEIVYRWGETATLSSFTARLLDVMYGCIFVLAVVFTCHAAVQLWIPSIFNYYDYEHGWIM